MMQEKGGKPMEKLWKKLVNRETILYMIFGVATTVVNYGIFHGCYAWLFGYTNGLWANFLAFVGAVIFAFVVNKIFVFESGDWSVGALRKELPPFLGGRIGSFLVEEAGLMICQWCQMDEMMWTLWGVKLSGLMVAKVILSVAVVILNYILCKWIVFKK